MKTCRECNTQKKFEEFRRDKNMEDGYKPICKQCVKKKKREKEMAREEKEKKIINEAFQSFYDLLGEYRLLLENSGDSIKVPKRKLTSGIMAVFNAYNRHPLDYYYELQSRLSGDKYIDIYNLNDTFDNYRDGEYLLVRRGDNDNFFDELDNLIREERGVIRFSHEQLCILSSKHGFYLHHPYADDYFRDNGLKIRYFDNDVAIL